MRAAKGKRARVLSRVFAGSMSRDLCEMMSGGRGSEVNGGNKSSSGVMCFLWGGLLLSWAHFLFCPPDIL